MYIPKKYGQSKVDSCPFCGKSAVIMNPQNIPVCASHKDETLDDLKCVCGETLDVLHGKYGAFFKCIDCGNMNLRKVLEINTIKPKFQEQKSEIKPAFNSGQYASHNSNAPKKPSSGKTTITVRSDDPRYFD
jgi:hypothetical protein